MKRIDYYPPLYKDYYYHVFNRGNGTEKIFFNRDNYSYFINLYLSFLKDYVNLYAFCLIPNHFHMLIKVTAGSPEQLSKQFKDFFITYSMSINKQQDRMGNLFHRRFKRRLIYNDNYLMQVIHYIHFNPVHHNITDTLENYPYSSYKLIVKGNKLTNGDEVLSWFGGLNSFVEFHKKDSRNSGFEIE